MSDRQEEYKGIDACIYRSTDYKDIPKSGIMRIILIHNYMYVTEFLRYNKCETVI